MQLEQLAHGARIRRCARLRRSRRSTHCVACDVLAVEDADRLREAYALCERARNYRYLLTGSSGDSLPTDGDEAEKLARMLGYVHRPQQMFREEYRRVTRRAARGRRARLLRPRGRRVVRERRPHDVGR